MRNRSTCTLLPCQGDQGGWARWHAESNALTVLQRAGQLFSVYSLIPGKNKCGHFCSSDTLQFLTPASCPYPLGCLASDSVHHSWNWALSHCVYKALCSPLESHLREIRPPGSWLFSVPSISHVYLLSAPHWPLMTLTGSWFYSSSLGVLCLAQSRCSVNSGLGVDICFSRNSLWFP